MNKKKLNDNEELMDDVKKAEAAADSGDKAAVAEKPKKKKSLFASRKFKKGGMAIILTCVVIAIVVLINVIMSIVAEKVPALNVDFTATQKYELSQSTKDFLSTVDKDITIRLLTTEDEYMSAGDYYIQVMKLIKQYPICNSHINIEYSNIVSDPSIQNKYPNETLYQASIIVECGDNYKVLDPSSDIFEYTTNSSTYQQEISGVKVEGSIASAILNVTTNEKTKVAFLTGLGDTDYSAFQKVLESNNYDVSTITAQTGEISSDISILVLCAPSADLNKEAVERISTYLENGGDYGKTLFYIPSYEQVSTPNIDALLEEWNMSLENGIVAETDANHLVMQNSYFFSIADYADTTFTAGLKNPSIPMLMGYSRPITISNTDKVKALLTTSDSAALYPFDADQNYNPSNETKEKKNIAVMSTYTGTNGNSYVIVDGSYFSFTSQALSGTSYNNGAYYVNLFNKQSGHEDQTVSIDTKTTQSASLGIVSSQITFLTALFMVIIPLGILIAGLVIWLRRRNR